MQVHQWVHPLMYLHLFNTYASTSMGALIDVLAFVLYLCKYINECTHWCTCICFTLMKTSMGALINCNHLYKTNVYLWIHQWCTHNLHLYLYLLVQMQVMSALITCICSYTYEYKCKLWVHPLMYLHLYYTNISPSMMHIINCAHLFYTYNVQSMGAPITCMFFYIYEYMQVMGALINLQS